jgi:very-short-patch-repair endonuclease
MRGPDKLGTGRARRLRRDATDAEMRLWLKLRDRRLAGFKFSRQQSIGPYIVDFVCRDRKLVVEVDGGQHADNVRDRIRDDNLAAEGYRVLRFWNNDVLSNTEGVLTAIQNELEPHGT